MENKIVPYTEREKLLLASLVDKYNLVESKKTDASTVQTKQKEWQKIATEYNSQADVTVCRTAIQLKKLWNNLKQRKRKSTTAIKYARLVTGGGPAPKEVLDPVMEAVDVAAPHMDVTLECPWDSTAQFEEKITENISADIDIFSPQCSGRQIELNDANDINMPFSSPSEGIPRVHKTSIVPSSTPSKPRSRCFLVNESNLRIKKIKEAIEQQSELHQIKLKIEEEQLLKVTAERKKMEAEQELATLILEKYKKENLLI